MENLRQKREIKKMLLAKYAIYTVLITDTFMHFMTIFFQFSGRQKRRLLRLVLQKGQLIVLESTTYPGTTAELVLPMLEDTGLKAGKDFFLAFSPERIDPANKKWTIANTTKVVGGICKQSTELTAAVYGSFTTVHKVSSTQAAEMVKLLENTFHSMIIDIT